MEDFVSNLKIIRLNFSFGTPEGSPWEHSARYQCLLVSVAVGWCLFGVCLVSVWCLLVAVRVY